MDRRTADFFYAVRSAQRPRQSIGSNALCTTMTPTWECLAMTVRGFVVSVLTTALALPAVVAAETATVGAENTSATTVESAADASNSDQIAEVVITAQKRISTVQTTPISVTAVSGEELQARGVESLAVLAQGTPGVSLKTEGPSQTEIEMRGMTSSGGNSATVGFYIDDIPLSGPASAQNGHVVIDPDLYDLNRIEILRGPQGTLYGASSMGGTVRLITNQPDPSGFQVTGESSLSGTD